VETTDPTESAAAAAAMMMAMTSIETNWMTAMNRESPLKERWQLDCATTIHMCGDWGKFK
jgi:hypothetical protein